jgi:hypothetical protein
MAKHKSDSTIDRVLNLRIVFLLVTMNCRQWVVDAIPCRRPHAVGNQQLVAGS